MSATGKTTSELVWLKNPGGLGVNGEGFSNWEQTLLIEGGPDVVIQFETLEANGVTYEAFVTGKGHTHPNSLRQRKLSYYFLQLSFGTSGS